MSLRSFWLIFLKVIGFFLLYGAVSVIPTLVTVPMMLGNASSAEDIFIPAAIILLSGAVYGALVYLFLFRSGYVMRLFRLEDEFDEDNIELDTAAVTILTFTCIIIGGIMLVHGLPMFIKELTSFLAAAKFYGAEQNIGWTLYYLSQCVIGALLIFKNKPVVAFIEERANDSLPAVGDDDILDVED